ncbi:hypothetical protein GGR56DRAFT_678287 [Xylariaceae sp. FL0804]|nr:hypothetical protein GGR56DRAFT_678287 [Xylariaceae sp. FL0804]
MAKDKQPEVVSVEANLDDLEAQKQQQRGPASHARHKSSGTINVLMEKRRAASDQYADARRAEAAYLTKKNATRAREGLDDTKSHFRQALAHLGAGFRGLLDVLRALPYLLGERREQWGKRAEARRRGRAEEQRRRLEEKLARGQAGEGEGEEGDEEKKDEEADKEDGKKKNEKKK